MSKKKPFTKIDLFVVIISLVLIAILIAFITPPFRHDFPPQAPNILCKTNLKQWGLVFKLYGDDNDEKMPTADQLKDWPGLFYEYHESPNLLFCPMAIKTKADGAKPHFAAWQSNGVEGSYGINLSMASDSNDDRYWQTLDVRRNDRIPVMGDANWKVLQPTPFDSPPPTIDAPFDEKNHMKRACIPRHLNDTTNWLFADLNIRSVPLKELWLLWWYKHPEGKTWMEGLEESGEPEWPEWMKNMKDPLHPHL